MNIWEHQTFASIKEAVDFINTLNSGAEDAKIVPAQCYTHAHTPLDITEFHVVYKKFSYYSSGG